jgi:hypothetical protein
VIESAPTSVDVAEPEVSDADVAVASEEANGDA